MKKETWSALCLLAFTVLLATQCSVMKRRYVKGFYVSATRKAHPEPLSLKDKSFTARINSKPSSGPPTGARMIQALPPVSPALKRNATEQKLPGRVNRIPPDSCGDIITFMDGDELKIRIEEIAPDYVAYRRCDYLTGPLIKTATSNIFRIKYGNGMVRVFKQAPVPAYQSMPGGAYAMPTIKKTNGWGVASFVTSLFSFLILPAFAAVICGIVALVQFENHPEKYKGRWMAVTGLAIGLIAAALIILSLFI